MTLLICYFLYIQKRLIFHNFSFSFGIHSIFLIFLLSMTCFQLSHFSNFTDSGYSQQYAQMFMVKETVQVICLNFFASVIYFLLLILYFYDIIIM